MSPLDPGPNVFITVTGSGDGEGTVVSVESSPTLNINCHFPTSSCQDDFYDAGGGGEFLLRATPDPGSLFVGWSGDCAASGAADTCLLTFTEAEASRNVSFTVGVEFALEPPPPPMPAVIRGTMLGGDDVTPLPGITVNVSQDGVGIGSAVTDAQGQFSVDVIAGDLSLFASGVCDPVHPCDFEYSFNATEAEPVTVGAGEELEFNPRARRGYHLGITSGTDDLIVQTGAEFTVEVGYEVWNRANLPGATPRVTLGIEATAGPSPPFLQPGVYPGETGTQEMTLTAPTDTGTYGVFAFLTPATATVDARAEYERLFPNGRLFIRLFTLTVE